MHVFEVCPNLNSNQIHTFKTDPSSTLVWYVCCAYLFEELYFDKQEAFNQEVPQSHTLAPANGAWHMQPVYYMYAHAFKIYIYIYIYVEPHGEGQPDGPPGGYIFRETLHCPGVPQGSYPTGLHFMTV